MWCQRRTRSNTTWMRATATTKPAKWSAAAARAHDPHRPAARFSRQFPCKPPQGYIQNNRYSLLGSGKHLVPREWEAGYAATWLVGDSGGPGAGEHWLFLEYVLQRSAHSHRAIDVSIRGFAPNRRRVAASLVFLPRLT